MGQVVPNIVEIPHQEAYTTEDPERRSPSLESPRPPSIIDEGDVIHGNHVVDVVDGRAIEANIASGELRMEERPLDIIQEEKGKMHIEEARPIIEEGTPSGALNLPYVSDDDEEEYIYVPLEKLEGRDV